MSPSGVDLPAWSSVLAETIKLAWPAGDRGPLRAGKLIREFVAEFLNDGDSDTQLLNPGSTSSESRAIDMAPLEPARSTRRGQSHGEPDGFEFSKKHKSGLEVAVPSGATDLSPSGLSASPQSSANSQNVVINNIIIINNPP